MLIQVNNNVNCNNALLYTFYFIGHNLPFYCIYTFKFTGSALIKKCLNSVFSESKHYLKNLLNTAKK